VDLELTKLSERPSTIRIPSKKREALLDQGGKTPKSALHQNDRLSRRRRENESLTRSTRKGGRRNEKSRREGNG